MRFCLAIGAALLSFMTVVSAISKAAEIDSSAEFAFVTDFGSGKVLMEKLSLIHISEPTRPY